MVQQGDFGVARSVGEHALILAREAGDDVTAAEALDCLHGVASEQGDFERAETLMEECLSAWRKAGAVSGFVSSFAGSLVATGYDSYAHGDHETAAARLQEALTVAKELHIARAQAGCLQYLAMVARAQGRLGEARRFVDEALAICETLHDVRNLGALTNIRGLIALDEGNLEEALVDLQAVLPRAVGRGDQTQFIRTVEAIGRVVAEHGDFRRAATLFGGAALLREAVPCPVRPVDEHWYTAVIARWRDGLGDLAFKTAWDDGRAMSMEDLVRLASGCSPSG